MLRENEDRLRASSFEMVLSQLPLLPQKFMFSETQTPEALQRFDNDWWQLKLSDQMFEHITFEFEDSIN